ncbi:hypothetical protein SAMN05421780_105112 [Flexibacter flexilis DSM 6793]|uniref:Uncharacterized protein n=1 Tax=Flexibacter flexilis DSM 6793 TaxID=927664 RepID=A0A1I1IVN7_9BACT|nr:hypothetical protein SAMN05421780_105112 [Flexibacter flexilis DSM 6793]
MKQILLFVRIKCLSRKKELTSRKLLRLNNDYSIVNLEFLNYNFITIEISHKLFVLRTK